jgi:hypothetical protein
MGPPLLLDDDEASPVDDEDASSPVDELDATSLVVESVSSGTVVDELDVPVVPVLPSPVVAPPPPSCLHPAGPNAVANARRERPIEVMSAPARRL